jgi:hypothetical protein
MGGIKVTLAEKLKLFLQIQELGNALNSLKRQLAKMTAERDALLCVEHEDDSLALENEKRKCDTLTAERDALLSRFHEWRDLSDSALRLRCGEMTADEIRSIRAVLRAILPA